MRFTRRFDFIECTFYYCLGSFSTWWLVLHCFCSLFLAVASRVRIASFSKRNRLFRKFLPLFDVHCGSLLTRVVLSGCSPSGDVRRIMSVSFSLELLLQIPRGSRPILSMFFSFFSSSKMVALTSKMLSSVLLVLVGCATALPSNTDW